MGRPRVLFLHGLEGAPGTQKHKLLEKAFGRSRVKAPNLKTRQAILVFSIAFILLLALVVCGTCLSFIYAKWYIGMVVVVLALALIGAAYLIAGRGATHLMMKQAVSIAERTFHEFRPNVIVASSFGTVAALNMDVPKCPMLLFSPAQDQYSRYMKIKQLFSIGDYPYVMIVHGTHDKTVPLDDSIRLVETSDVGRCRLEVIDDNHTFRTLSADDMKQWVMEVYENGMMQVQRMAAGGNKKVDPTLFENTGETSGSDVERGVKSNGSDSGWTSANGSRP